MEHCYAILTQFCGNYTHNRLSPTY